MSREYPLFKVGQRIRCYHRQWSIEKGKHHDMNYYSEGVIEKVKRRLYYTDEYQRIWYRIDTHVFMGKHTPKRSWLYGYLAETSNDNYKDIDTGEICIEVLED